MAIYHFSMKPIARSGGRSAVASAAYRAAERLTNERDGLTHDFSNRTGVEHAEVVLPAGSSAYWAMKRSALWNAAERVEKRSDARIAREFEIALPHELSAEQRLALTRAFAEDLANRYGAAVDFAIHRPGGASDIRNSHAHLMMTTREVRETGLGDKTLLERENRWLLANHLPPSQLQLKDLRQAWEHLANRHLAMAGHDIRIDHRSHLEAGLTIAPTEHVGVHATQIDRQGGVVSRVRIDRQSADRNAETIRRRPDEILKLITNEKSVFSRYDIARALHRTINDDPQTFQNAFAAVMASKALVELRPDSSGLRGRDGEARYSTVEMVAIEGAIASNVMAMKTRQNHGVFKRHVDAAIAAQDRSIQAVSASPAQGLSAEQRQAIEHVTGPSQIAVVIGFAGAGKSTMLAAARQAWEAQGYRVHGAALAGKAAEGLEQSSGITSRTLASWEYSWQADRSRLNARDVFVIDEGGMVGSRQLARFVDEVKRAGAKLVLVGDHEQLQAIGAGAPFRAIAEAVGHAQLSDVRRQRTDWQKQASIDFASHRTAEGLTAYKAHGNIQLKANRDDVLKAIIADYVADRSANPNDTRIAMAHRRDDVRAINAGIRARLQDRGELANSTSTSDDRGEERTYQTNNGKRSFARGDRIVFLENDRDLAVKNGMLGEVIAVAPDAIQVRLDGKAQTQDGQRQVTVPVNRYQAFDHGYATTIHKTQGATVDRSFVLASTTMDRHLTYVAMTRHREEVQLYAGLDAFKTERALTEALSRSGVKETTLDYTHDFANRRGMEDQRGQGESDVASHGITKGVQPIPDTAVPKPMQEPRPPTPLTARTIADGGSPHQDRSDDERDHDRRVLVAAVKTYAMSVEAVGRSKAMVAFDRDWEAAKQLAPQLFKDAPAAMDALRGRILNENADPVALANQLSASPETFGALAGKTGLFGDNAERKHALSRIDALASHVHQSAKTWQRRLAAECGSERWKREKQDMVEVLGPSRQSEALLRQLDDLPYADKAKFVEQLAGTVEGRRALAEAKDIVTAIETRFGRADPSDLADQLKRMGPDQAGDIERIRQVARLADRSHRAELTQQMELERSLKRGRTLGLGM
ncbi:Ti-type conjugative transfer relaxase TraA (plasmid) [Rhizobium ruizarguesonis]|uniref:Ti-type conjugative transfer relaxase TraA n=1 Tax=Rhizobium ruizarguesonis TaxID=2081791 RepID=UPI00102F8AAD|nr:Ti-type conjugative transfer relaxase TraA [Rhizobium ruizarguesonis]TAT73416.1 Ti-type conjugative transfer relaxase TraA [Rhizobium ruizarguesonis]TAT81436.1 Ti-type conjugative transfer relaxase TraA [Rhizobium ruizarguesonis]TAZ68415.1 Ti-type conjugative transfer relaxase TraA [Rhizobium ruizarguesonis]TAZ90784.1 Ti-type conjugative transfer relaxase TraA [Rhizobium ruizarguesonis]TBB81278.1 Ti-type conjugative transfer relaxase TraA [Rhizobium ruizarguesonis]